MVNMIPDDPLSISEPRTHDAIAAWVCDILPGSNQLRQICRFEGRFWTHIEYPQRRKMGKLIG